MYWSKHIDYTSIFIVSSFIVVDMPVQTLLDWPPGLVSGTRTGRLV